MHRTLQLTVTRRFLERKNVGTQTEHVREACIDSQMQQLIIKNINYLLTVSGPRRVLFGLLAHRWRVGVASELVGGRDFVEITLKS